ncbi:MAG: PAS domain S-box protein [Desulfobacterales bacterium]|nr:PAS domain S-box protein [Desulfobacterales bacterium]
MDKHSLHTHLNDAGRLAALRDVALMDTPAEEAFDRLSRLAARFTGAPVALVSLVGRDRQFFKSAVGLPEPWQSRRETPLSHSFCQYNHVSGAPLVISDARKEPLFRKNLAIRDLNVIAYLGIPLVTRDDYVLGSFCVIDGIPRIWSATDIDTVTDLAASVMTEIDLRAEVAQRTKAEMDLAKLWGAVKNSPLSIIMTDVRGIVEYVNPGFRTITGFTEAEVVGKNVNVLRSDVHNKTFFDDLWRTLKAGRIWQGEMCSRKKDGALFWEQASILPVKDPEGSVTHYVAIKEDITRKKKIEQLRDDVDRIMRHDLRQPLTGIITLPQVMRLQGTLTEDQVRMLKLIEDTGNRMADMIDLSLDMFRIETGEYRVTLQPVNAVAVIHQVEDQYRRLVEHKSLSCRLVGDDEELGPDGVRMIRSEERLLFPLISNLFVNAAEASPEGGDILFSITRFEDTTTISVTNRGVVPARVRKRFFEKYITHGKKNGTGLGTYSARLFARAMGYDIRMETMEDTGMTVVSIDIPGSATDISSET